MKSARNRHLLLKTSLVVLLAGSAATGTAQISTQTPGSAQPQSADQVRNPVPKPPTGTNSAARSPEAARESDHLAEATGRLNRAIGVIQQMERNRDLAALMQRSKGVFVVPDSTRVAVGVGARGGKGVLLVRRADGWGTPGFYNMASLTVGPQLGAEGGAIAFVLNDQKALNSFAQNNKFSLNADAGLTMVDWSKKGEGAIGWGDITAWADTEGLFGGATLSVTDLSFDAAETAAYYNRAVAARDVLSGKLANPHAAALREALATRGTGGGAAGVGGSGDTKTRSGDTDYKPSGR